MGKFLIGAVLGVALMVVGQAVAQPALTDADRAYYATHPDVVANVWKAQHSEPSFDPGSEAKNVAGYFRGDSQATLLVAAATFADPNEWAERPYESRVDDQLDPTCRALTHR